jgi:hypothetical protein
VPSTAAAQQPPPPAAQQSQSRSVAISGYASIGNFRFTATESFDAILGKSSAPIFGGGARVGLPFGGLFADIGAWRMQQDGERVFVFDGEVFPLNVPTEITLTPIEISAGWQFRVRRAPKILPYAGAGLTSMRFEETTDSATGEEDGAETFSGFHVFGGAEYKVTRWIGIAGEAAWTTIPDAIGEGGASAAFDETDLGGVSFRLKVTIGR